jgi:predicted short-subunit dehydrogenase-like oxidoreductase (DUF2520 family)
MSASRTFAFIGAGRLATALALALTRRGEQVSAVASRQRASADALAARLPGAAAVLPAQALADADWVFLTVPDDQIAVQAAALPWRAGQRVIHCSGATELGALRPAAEAGALTGGFHPLQIFSDPLRAADLIPGSSVAIEAAPPLEAELQALAALLGMCPLRLPPGARARYHGGASFAASFLLSMLQEACALWAGFGIAEDDALQALMPLARGTLEAAAAKGLPGALAGPLSRGDVGVVERHLQAMADAGPEHLAFYRELSRRQLELARRAGRLSTAQLAALNDALNAARPGELNPAPAAA